MKTTAYRKELVKFDSECKDINDNRKKISKAVFSYFTVSGIEYRKSFVSVKGQTENYFWNIAPEEIQVIIY